MAGLGFRDRGPRTLELVLRHPAGGTIQLRPPYVAGMIARTQSGVGTARVDYAASGWQDARITVRSPAGVDVASAIRRFDRSRWGQRFDVAGVWTIRWVDEAVGCAREFSSARAWSSSSSDSAWLLRSAGPVLGNIGDDPPTVSSNDGLRQAEAVLADASGEDRPPGLGAAKAGNVHVGLREAELVAKVRHRGARLLGLGERAGEDMDARLVIHARTPVLVPSAST